MYLILGLALIWGSVNNFQIFIQFHLLDLGGSILIFSIINTFVLGIDFWIMHNAYKIRKKLGNKKYLFVVLIVMLLKYLVLIIFVNTYSIYITVIIDPIFFGLLIPSTSVIIKELVNNDESTLALSMHSSLNLLTVAFFSIIYGIFYYQFGSIVVFGLMVINLILACIIINKISFQN